MAKVLPLILVPACASVILAGCGGGPANDPAPADGTMAPATAVAAGAQTPAGKTSDAFGNFNAPLWNDHQWYECNCGKNPEAQSDTAAWNKLG